MKRTSAAIKKEQQRNRQLKRQLQQLRRLQRQQVSLQDKIDQQQRTRVQYNNFVSRRDETTLLRLVQRNALIEGIVRIVVTNVVEGGISIHVQMQNGRILHPDTYREGASLPTRWVPLLTRMVTDVLTIGYTVVMVNPTAQYPEDRIFCPAPETVQVRWTTVNRRLVYAAFDTITTADVGGGGYWSATGDGGGAGSNGKPANEPIPNSYVFVMYPPSRFKECTSPVSRSLPLIMQLETLVANYVRGDTARTRQPLIIETAVRDSTKPGVDVPYVLAELSPSGNVTHRLQEVGSVTKSPYGKRPPLPPPRRSHTLSSTGQLMEFLDPGESVARSTAVPTIDGRDTTVMMQELISMIGRTMGVSADYLRGGDSGGTKLVAGVEASRKQLAVMVNNLQGPIARFLEHVFARADEEILREMFAGGSQTKDDTGRQRSPPPPNPVNDRFRANGGDDDGGDVSAIYVDDDRELLATGVILDSTYMGLNNEDQGASGDDDEEDPDFPGLGGEDRVVVQFNNTPYLDYENARLLYQDRLITSEALRHTAARMFRLPESFLTSPDIKIGPFQVLIQPTLVPETAPNASDTAESKSSAQKRSSSSTAQPPAKRRKPAAPQESRRAKLGPPPTSTA